MLYERRHLASPPEQQAEHHGIEIFMSRLVPDLVEDLDMEVKSSIVVFSRFERNLASA